MDRELAGRHLKLSPTLPQVAGIALLNMLVLGMTSMSIEHSKTQ